jgi:uncharacterized membrane protein
MDFYGADWARYLIRILHVGAGIFWIGRHFYFVRMKSEGSENESGAANSFWLLHGGHFFEVVPTKLVADTSAISVVKFDILTTWISGALLLFLVYFMNANVYMHAQGATLTPGLTVLMAVGTIILAGLVYDTIAQHVSYSRPRLGSVLIAALVICCIFGFCAMMPSQAVAIHIGAMMATWMAGNSFFRIVPLQRKILVAVGQGQPAAPEIVNRAKLRSLHNSYFSFPVLAMMLSGHAPFVLGSSQCAAILALIGLSAAFSCRALITKERRPLAALIASVALILAIYLAANLRSTPPTGAAVVEFSQVQKIISNRCAKCHSAHPEIAQFGVSPGNVNFDSPDQIHRLAERIEYRAAIAKTMPLANMTGITEDERQALQIWAKKERGL